jgi:hypothetical protein
MPGRINLKELPRQDAPDYFRLLVRNCIETYKELPNDAMCLDYNKVSGKLRALVLDDEEYKQETRNIYAKQRLEELYEIDNLAKLALNEDDDDEKNDPRNRGKKRTVSGADKDMLNMRFKAAQMRRELIASLNEDSGASERDAVNFMFVGMTREEIEKSARDEIYDGDSDGALDELTSRKEEAPEGTSGKVRVSGRSKPLDDEEFFEVLESGEIVEKKTVQKATTPVLVDGRRVFSPGLQASNAVCVLSTLLSNVRHCSRKAQDWLWHCFACCRLYGARLLSALGICSGTFPLPAGAQRHNRYVWQTGGLGIRFPDSRIYPHGRRFYSFRSIRQLRRLASDLLCRDALPTFVSPLDFGQVSCLFHESIFQECTGQSLLILLRTKISCIAYQYYIKVPWVCQPYRHKGGRLCKK